MNAAGISLGDALVRYRDTQAEPERREAARRALETAPDNGELLDLLASSKGENNE